MKKSTVVAFGVLVALVGVVYWLEQDDGSSTDVERIFDVAEDDIARVEIRPADGEAVVIERDGERFRLVSPVDADTDETEVTLVVSNLATMTAIRSFEREEEDYGLDTPKLTVTFVDTGGNEHAIRFGDDTVTGSNQYAERTGSTNVMVVGNYLALNLGRSLWDLRDKSIYDLPDDAEAERVRISRGDDVLELVLQEGAWFTSNPPRSRVDRFEVTGMVARYRRADMLDIPEGEAIDTPAIRLDVTFAGDVDPMSIEIGEKRNVDYLARVPGREQVFLFAGGLVRELQRDASEWRSKKLLHHATTETTITTITADGDERTMSREQAQELLQAVSDATASEIVTERPSGEPDYVITVTTEDEQDEIAIHVNGGKTYATRADEDVSLVLPADAWSAIQSELSADVSQ